jgi:hypothetical protein
MLVAAEAPPTGLWGAWAGGLIAGRQPVGGALAAIGVDAFRG